jgi:hypothetical protein
MMEDDSQNQLIEVKELLLCHTFPHTINKVWSFIKDVKQTIVTSNTLRTEAKFIKGSSSFEEGSVFSFIIKNYYQFTAEVKKVLETEYYKKIIWQVESEPFFGRYNYIYELFHVSVDNSCFLKWTLEYDRPRNLNKLHLDFIQTERKDLIERFDTYLNGNSLNKTITQIESTLLNGKPDSIFKLISSDEFLKKLEKISKENCDDSADKEVLDNIDFIIDPEYRVLKFEYIKSEEKLILKVEFTYEEISPIPYEVLFEIFILENNCFFKITHTFSNIIDEKLLEKISKKKRKALKCMMKKFNI